MKLDSVSENEKSVETFIIKGDSIWCFQKHEGKNVSQGERFINMEGKIIFYKHGAKGSFENKPFYLASLVVMSCDTCPEFWKYTLKSKDSLDLEPLILTWGQTDTIIEKGDTMYRMPQIIEYPDATDLNRERTYFFTITRKGDLLIDDKIYHRVKKEVLNSYL